jgi:DNA repair exonuclease SbcCD ATPase subunit
LTKKKDQKTTLRTQVESEQQAKVALMDLQTALESEKGNLQAKLERKKARKEALKAALDEESRAKEELKLHKEKLEGDFEALRQQLDSRDTDKAALRLQFESIAAELAKVKADEERQMQALAQAKDQVTALTQANEDLQQQLSNSHLKVAKKKNKVATLKTRIGDLETSLARVEQERNELSDNISHLKLSLEGQGKAELQRILEEKEQYASEIAQLRQSLSDSLAKSTTLEGKAEALAARLASFGEFDRAKNEQLQTLKQENAQLQGELATLMGLNSADEIQVLRHEIEAKNLRIANLEAKLQEPERGNMPPTEQHQACLKCSMF